MGRDRKIRIFVLFMCLGGGLLTVMIGQMPGAGAQAIAQGIAPGPASAYRLVGTVESGPFTGAVLDDSEGGQAFYRLNEKLADESRIVKVKSDHIVLKWPDGATTELYASQGSSVSAAGTAQPRSTPDVWNRVEPVQPPSVRPEPSPGGDALGERQARIEQNRRDLDAGLDKQKGPRQRSSSKRGRSSGTDEGD